MEYRIAGKRVAQGMWVDLNGQADPGRQLRNAFVTPIAA